MNIAIQKSGFTVTRDLYTPEPSAAGIDFVQCLPEATAKFRKMGREDAHAGKILSKDEICGKLEARFAGTEPLIAQAFVRVLTNCYAEGVKEVLHETNKLYS